MMKSLAIFDKFLERSRRSALSEEKTKAGSNSRSLSDITPSSSQVSPCHTIPISDNSCIIQNTEHSCITLSSGICLGAFNSDNLLPSSNVEVSLNCITSNHRVSPSHIIPSNKIPPNKNNPSPSIIPSNKVSSCCTTEMILNGVTETKRRTNYHISHMTDEQYLVKQSALKTIKKRSQSKGITKKHSK